MQQQQQQQQQHRVMQKHPGNQLTTSKPAHT
jgi:hypothetical protein